MRHHFADMLDREGNYWTMTENRARYQQGIDEAKPGSKRVKVATIGKSTDNWQNVFTFPNLEELTLHEPSKEQFAAIGELVGLQRLRITHARPKSIDVLAGLEGVEELVLEYVSGFSDLSPLRALPRLRALHLENLRKVSDFGGLAGCAKLRFLAIDGTLDWKQPVQDFEFLRDLPKLEVLKLWQMKCRAPYPALLPALSLPRLKKFHAHGTYLPVEECALLEEGLSGVEGADWGPYQSRRGMKELAKSDARSKLSADELRAAHPEVLLFHDGKRYLVDEEDPWFYLTGTGSGLIKFGSPTFEARSRAFAEKYAALRADARAIIDEVAT